MLLAFRKNPIGQEEIYCNPQVNNSVKQILKIVGYVRELLVMVTDRESGLRQVAGKEAFRVQGYAVAPGFS